jgi:hypothetical protein
VVGDNLLRLLGRRKEAAVGFGIVTRAIVAVEAATVVEVVATGLQMTGERGVQDPPRTEDTLVVVVEVMVVMDMATEDVVLEEEAVVHIILTVLEGHQMIGPMVGLVIVHGRVPGIHSITTMIVVVDLHRISGDLVHHLHNNNIGDSHHIRLKLITIATPRHHENYRGILKAIPRHLEAVEAVQA